MKDAGKTLVLLTAGFPFGSGEQFLETEIRYLCEAFEKVIIVPKERKPPMRTVPSNAAVDGSFHFYQAKTFSYRAKTVLRCLLSACFYRELFARPGAIYGISRLRVLMPFIDAALQTRAWFGKNLAEKSIGLENTVFYTYWFGDQTLGLAISGRGSLRPATVSRAHGIDLYEERSDPPYLPCRKEILKGVKRVYAVSDNGKRYLSRRHPERSAVIGVSRLGVDDPGFDSAPSSDGVFRVVSCSFLVPVKRVDRIVGGLAELALRHPDRKIEWCHIGEGPLRWGLEAMAGRTLPPNVSSRFAGLFENREVINFYRDNMVDVFINVSESEGVPVSIMEAQSCAIPVIATAVGGASEIVNNESGFLLGADPGAADIADALEAFMPPRANGEKKNRSKENWRGSYDARKNYSGFVMELRGLAGQKLSP